MKLISNTLNTMLKLSVCALLALTVSAQAQDKKVDPTGKWEWVMVARQQGGQDRTNTLTLKLEGEKVTGKVSTPGRDGTARETDIADGKMKGDVLSFNVIREFNNNSMTNKYTGTVTATTIKGKSESERNGEVQSRDWEAKRVVEKK